MRLARVTLALALSAACRTIEREAIHTPNAPAPIGPYSQAVRVADELWLAGQVGLDPTSGALVSGGSAAEAERALLNLEAVLAAADFDLGDVVSTTIYLVDLSDFAQVNEVYARRFVSSPPARATVQVAALPKGARVEIQMIARRVR